MIPLIVSLWVFLSLAVVMGAGAWILLNELERMADKQSGIRKRGKASTTQQGANLTKK